jgi:hypothetical protein
MVTSVSGAPALRQGDAALRKLLAEH